MITKDEKEREKVRKALRKTGDAFLEQVHVHLDHRLMETIRTKGFSKQFSEFCDEIGRSG